jgi:hypothetical protein
VRRSAKEYNANLRLLSNRQEEEKQNPNMRGNEEQIIAEEDMNVDRRHHPRENNDVPAHSVANYSDDQVRIERPDPYV